MFVFHTCPLQVVIPDWDKAFLPTKPEQKNQLFKLLNAANYLNVKGLLLYGCKFVAEQIQSKDPDFVRDYLNMENDYTPEELAALKAENAWAADL